MDAPARKSADKRTDSLAALPLREVIALALRAGRRRLGVSQREFALRAGMSKSSLARLEMADTAEVGLGAAQSALFAVGLRLAVVDESGGCWEVTVGALDSDQLGLADAAGRRYPAHVQEHPDAAGADLAPQPPDRRPPRTVTALSVDVPTSPDLRCCGPVLRTATPTGAH